MLVGTGLSVTAVALGQRDLLRLGGLLLLLPLVALALTVRARSSLTLVQRSRPVVLASGAPGTVRLRVRGTGGRSGVRVWLEDTVPFVLGTVPRLPVPPLAPDQTLDLKYSVSSDVRGAYRTGPAVLRIGDPLGLCDVRRVLPGTTTVDVLPPVHPLPVLPLPPVAGPGRTQARSSTGSEADDIALRRYRDGDDLRRVHWRSTARRGKVMVREDERGGRADVTLLLDRRATAHSGHGAASSLEWLVSAAASIAVHLQQRGHTVHLLHGGAGAAVGPVSAPGAAQPQALLRELAALTPGGDDDLRLAVQSLERSPAGMLVALLGAVDAEDVTALVAARDRSAAALALLQQTGTWGRGGGRPEAGAATRRAQLVLSGGGWQTATAARGDDIADVWVALARRGTARRPA